MLVIGLTGGIGSGKSTVAQLFVNHGIPIIDADIIARDVTQPGNLAYLDIIKHFGNDILLSDGKLDRPKLREIIFSDSKQRLWLESCLHPLISKEMKRQIKTFSTPYCIAVIPLLLEVEFYSLINRILVVDAPEHLQIERIAARDNASKPQIEAIIKTQAKRADRIARAHDVITNEGTLTNLSQKIEKLHQKYSEMGKSAEYK
jgi:dephospho-CoA kinase